jgi:hypothetical protein
MHYIRYIVELIDPSITIEVDMIRGGDYFLPIAFPMSESRLIWITKAMLNIRFNFLGSSMWIEEEIYDSKGKEVISTNMTPRFQTNASST